MVDADWLFLFWLQLLNHGVSFINCSAAICMQQAVPTLLEILYWRLLTYIIKSFDLFFLFLWIILVSRTPKSLSIGWTTSGEAASHPVNLIRLGNIHLDRPIYMSLLCVMIKRELAEAYIIFFFNVLKSSWTEKCQGSTPKSSQSSSPFFSRRVLPSDFLLNLYSAIVFDSCSTFVGGWVGA